MSSGEKTSRVRSDPLTMILAAAAVSLLLVGYFCGYRAMLVVPELPRPDGSTFIFGPPEYKVDVPAVDCLFYPAHMVDTILWPDGWLYLPDLDDILQ